MEPTLSLTALPGEMYLIKLKGQFERGRVFEDKYPGCQTY